MYPPGTLRIAGPEHVKQLANHDLVTDLGQGLTAGMQVTALGQRDELLDERTQVLRLGQRGDDLLVLDQRGWDNVGEHSPCGARGCG